MRKKKIGVLLLAAVLTFGGGAQAGVEEKLSSVAKALKIFDPKLVKRVVATFNSQHFVGGSRLSNAVYICYPVDTVVTVPDWGVIAEKEGVTVKEVSVSDDSGKSVLKLKTDSRLVTLPELKPGFYTVKVVFTEKAGGKVAQMEESGEFEVVELSGDLKKAFEEFSQRLANSSLGKCDRFLAWSLFFQKMSRGDYDFSYNRDFNLWRYRYCSGEGM
ncbi:hypothetical protein [Thermovibrio ammonificans]|uniref:Uncharacterized protein n=1 Tax=Thermovibrio ammonificans (strain DSM 15698 / JCM 12110 / HB-1) TaxID=648996 RepID=E8T3W5_THEA1|nr:hypothetical protein [Thermovibrio ammonificans]ADU96175.1 hypothetical protein Theam_0202 [Thermovibrio ammonificans HB-1]